MSPLTHRDAAVLLRDSVTALSRRLTTDYGDLVPDASAERTAALVATLEEHDGRGTVSDDDVRTLDSWIRLADSAVLHDDPGEAQIRADVARQLRAVRTLVATGRGLLTEDPRND